MQPSLDQVARERDLYRQLLELGYEDTPEVFLEKALTLFIELAGARRGYLELRDSPDADSASLSMVRGLDEPSLSADGLSRTVIAEALATGETVVAASATLDPRFQDHSSVRAQHLEAVLCAPIGRAPVIGVIYLQDRSEGGPFSKEDRQRAEVFARYLALFAQKLLTRRQKEVDDPAHSLRQKLKLDGIVGTSEALTAVLRQVALVAPLNVGVLLTGSSGTGKTRIARALHDNSPRAQLPFVEINCATLQETLAENELFGAKEGAHSTARQRVEGKLAAAERGTLFLDEVGDLTLPVQAKLLQFLQAGTYFPVGDAVARKANVRIIAATNADLGARVAAKLFREDLFYRLNVFPIRMPDLSERRGDIPALAAQFCRSLRETIGLPSLELSPGALLALEHMDWPGNVRELGTTIERGLIHAHGEGASRIERRHLFQNAEPPQDRERDTPPTFHDATREFQRRLLRTTLEREGWKVAAAARALDLTRAHVYNLMATFGIDRPGGAEG